MVKGGEPVSLDGALRLAIRIGEVVEAAHNAGLIDGRLDPERALVLGSGAAVKLVDFGLDRALGAEPAAEQLAWLAPEIASGGPCAERADVYGIGALLYVLLTGRPPARADVRSGASRPGGRRDLVPPGKLRQGIPRDVQAILFRALDHDPARRHEDVSVLLNDLSESLGLIAPVGRRHRPGAGLWRLAGRWRVAAGVLGAAAALAALWLVVPIADLPGGRSFRHGDSEPGRGGDARAATPPAALERPGPAAFTTAAPALPPRAALPDPLASPAPAPEPPRARQEGGALLPPALLPAPVGSPAPALSTIRPRPAPGRPAVERPAVESPARDAGRSDLRRPAERSAPPRPSPTPRLDQDDPGRAAAVDILRPARVESPRPIPPPREAPARDGGEDPSAIIDWLLRDRR